MDNDATDSLERIERARAGDRQALTDIFTRYRGRLRRGRVALLERTEPARDGILGGHHQPGPQQTAWCQRDCSARGWGKQRNCRRAHGRLSHGHARPGARGDRPGRVSFPPGRAGAGQRHKRHLGITLDRSPSGE